MEKLGLRQRWQSNNKENMLKFMWLKAKSEDYSYCETRNRKCLKDMPCKIIMSVQFGIEICPLSCCWPTDRFYRILIHLLTCWDAPCCRMHLPHSTNSASDNASGYLMRHSGIFKKGWTLSVSKQSIQNNHQYELSIRTRLVFMESRCSLPTRTDLEKISSTPKPDQVLSMYPKIFLQIWKESVHWFQRNYVDKKLSHWCQWDLGQNQYVPLHLWWRDVQINLFITLLVVTQF